MLGLPSSTIFDRRISKRKFYTHLPVSGKALKLFTDQIDTIHWTNKLAPDTINVDAGPKVSEIQILQIRLKTDNLDEHVVSLIDREIPYHLVFVVCYQDYGQLWIAYKEEAKNRDDKFKVDRYYKTEWFPLEELSLKIEGINLDQIYESFLKQIAGDNLLKHGDESEDLRLTIERSNQADKLRKAIAKLESKIAKEKQYNRQVKFMGDLRKLKQELIILENPQKNLIEKRRTGR